VLSTTELHSMHLNGMHEKTVTFCCFHQSNDLVNSSATNLLLASISLRNRSCPSLPFHLAPPLQKQSAFPVLLKLSRPHAGGRYPHSLQMIGILHLALAFCFHHAMLSILSRGSNRLSLKTLITFERPSIVFQDAFRTTTGLPLFVVGRISALSMRTSESKLGLNGRFMLTLTHTTLYPQHMCIAS
jgi:hypothetical protein